VLRALVDASSDEQTNRNGPLVHRDEHSTDSLWGDLRDVNDNDGGYPAHTETSDQSTSDKRIGRGGCDLDGHSNSKDEAGDHDCDATSDRFRRLTANQRAEEGARREDRDNEGSLRGGQGVTSGVLCRDGNSMTHGLLDIGLG